MDGLSLRMSAGSGGVDGVYLHEAPRIAAPQRFRCKQAGGRVLCWGLESCTGAISIRLDISGPRTQHLALEGNLSFELLT